MLRLTKALALLTAAYAILTMLPWYLLPLGWVVTGTCFAGVPSQPSPRFRPIKGVVFLIALIPPYSYWPLVTPVAPTRSSITP